MNRLELRLNSEIMSILQANVDTKVMTIVKPLQRRLQEELIIASNRYKLFSKHIMKYNFLIE